jgi:predicted phage terminase large subunit-like protein
MTSTEILQLSEDEFRKSVIKGRCELDHLFFVRYFFKARNGTKFLVNWHHIVQAYYLEKVFAGEIENIVFNVSPGSSKTEMVSIGAMARGLALNPWARFLHLSSGDDLVLLNSQTTRDIINSEQFQELWPLSIAADAKAKKRWNVMIDDVNNKGEPIKRKAGGVYAVALGGQITGFRAGHMKEGFQGAIIIDDPLKADEAYSPAAIKTANRRLISTVKSRKANPKTPIIVIMQRIGEKDPTGFIKGGNLSGKWVYVTIPALITEEYFEQLPPDLKRKIESYIIKEPKDDKGRFSYWEYKEPLSELLELESGKGADSDGNIISKHVFHAQYMQSPKAMGGNIIKGDRFPRVVMPPKIIYRKIYSDTAQKTAERNDYSVFECWGYGEDKKIYLLDLKRGKWEAPELKTTAIEFWNKHLMIKDQGALRKMLVEDKSSGTGLIQDLKRADRIPIEGIERNKDKYTRVLDVVSYIDSGYVCLIEGMPFNSDFVNECELFTADDTHAHDDQIDPMLDAIKDMLAAKPRSFWDL